MGAACVRIETKIEGIFLNAGLISLSAWKAQQFWEDPDG
jgi:hypothetical protein